jgi:hypothetical protein
MMLTYARGKSIKWMGIVNLGPWEKNGASPGDWRAESGTPKKGGSVVQTIRVLEKTGKDGMLSLRIPLGKPNAEYDVLVVVQPTTAATTPEERGWPPGYFERTFGSIDDETFVRPPQGELPRPVDFD